MKRLLIIISTFLLIVVVLAYGIRLFIFRPSPSTPPSLATAELTETAEQEGRETKEVIFNAITYSHDLFAITDVSKLRLIGNFTEKKATSQLMEDHNCVFAVNAGFYSTNNTPLGLFIGENYQQSRPLQSALFNGYLSFDMVTGAISSILPATRYVSAIQTGPLLIVDGIQQRLSINNDTHERRVVAGVTKSHVPIFLVIYVKGSVYQGPLLGDLPELLMLINTQVSTPLQDAINLDGGTASSFISPTLSIQELTSVGSIFCLTK